MNALHITLSGWDWWSLLLHFMTLSVLAVGGAMTTAPDIHRFLVHDHRWLTDTQFNTSIALAQAAPGPNLLFIALLGWNLGLNATGGVQAGWQAWGMGLLGACLTIGGIVLPSSALTLFTIRWAHRNRTLRIVRAFRQGMAPIVIALLIATGWLLASGNATTQQWPLALVTAVAALLAWRTRLHLLWLLGAGALLGALGWV